MARTTAKELDHLKTQIGNFLESHKTTMTEVNNNATHIFEVVCYGLFARYYERAGYRLQPENLRAGMFRFKFNTRGYPWNYSFFTVYAQVSGEEIPICEIRHNQTVVGAWDENINSGEKKRIFFAADVAVIEANCLPKVIRGKKRKGEAYWVENTDLITFGEAKKLVTYPMLLAQFFGIVHEIKPQFLQIVEESKFRHPRPTLFVSDGFTSGAENIISSFRTRNLSIAIVPQVNSKPIDELSDLLDGIQVVVESIS